MDRRDLEIPAAWESSEWSLRRRRQRFGERRLGKKEDAKRYLLPGPPPYID
jgi:hypothetical protein